MKTRSSIPATPIALAPITAQRIWGSLLVVLQAFALGYFFHTPLFSTTIAIATVFAVVSKKRFFTPQVAQRLPILLFVSYLVQRSVLPGTWSTGVRSFLVPDAALIAEYFLLYQVAMLLLRREEDSLPRFMPILAITAVVFIGDIRVGVQGRIVFQLVSLTLVLLSIGFFFANGHLGAGEGKRTSLKHKWLLVAVAAFCCVTAWVSASGLHRYARQIEATMNAMINPSYAPQSGGFSGTGQLGSVARQKGGSSDRISLRVFAQDAPGYLRGKAFETYNRGQWQSESKSRPIAPTPSSDAHLDLSKNSPYDETFKLVDNAVGDQASLEVWPNQSFQEVLFTPFGVMTVQAPIEQLSVDIHAIVTADMMPPDTRYFVWRSDTVSEWGSAQVASEMTEDDWARLTDLPDDLDPRIAKLAEFIIGESVTTSDKIAAVENFFLDHYEYQIGIEVPSETDPIVYFLLEHPPAHCEYFASGAVVLLRSVGVPCRYVTGFVAVEKNDYGDYWVSRNRDAHAWAEAYDPDHGWVLVEATPASGIPTSPQPSSAASQAWDAVRTGWQRTVSSIRAGGVRKLLRVLAQFFLHPISLIVFGMITVSLVIRHFHRRRRNVSLTQQNPILTQFQHLLDQMDRRWQRDGIIRKPHETLHQFAVRLELDGATPEHQISARWYRRFAAIRYGGRIDADAIEVLRDESGF
ncbi:Protein-glutamine gamma-glutamyltransferase [Planctomycetes bacterium CA13]|uniref:Protein-glutamine gamma-glutamyltransferase n=1 Tax=Novipirellula herctigrandis TaxID=2527986 RepID=A0A5C5Z9E1_9BACT|nr:Protein-glutamine gamma-glutamyltransferase [Planctomycetes bacterium CA13]